MTDSSDDRDYGSALLGRLFDVAERFAAYALAQAPPEVAAMAGAVRRRVLFQCSPLAGSLFLVSGPQDTVREFARLRGESLPPELAGEMGNIVGTFVTAGLNRMGTADREALALVDAGKADVVVVIEPGERATALLVPRDGQLSDAVALFYRQS